MHLGVKENTASLWSALSIHPMSTHIWGQTSKSPMDPHRNWCKSKFFQKSPRLFLFTPQTPGHGHAPPQDQRIREADQLCLCYSAKTHGSILPVSQESWGGIVPSQEYCNANLAKSLQTGKPQHERTLCMKQWYPKSERKHPALPKTPGFSRCPKKSPTFSKLLHGCNLTRNISRNCEGQWIQF